MTRGQPGRRPRPPALERHQVAAILNHEAGPSPWRSERGPCAAEARGFEPRKGANPNRISSTILCISSYANHGQIFLFLLVTALAVGRPMMSKAGPFW